MFGIGKLIEQKYGKPHVFLFEQTVHTNMYDNEFNEKLIFMFKCDKCSHTLMVTGNSSKILTLLDLAEKVPFVKLYGCDRR